MTIVSDYFVRIDPYGVFIVTIEYFVCFEVEDPLGNFASLGASAASLRVATRAIAGYPDASLGN